ncbi:MAG: hypothetical protein QW702_05955 [Candidatus Bathyarchaeia archaeon]
MMENRSLFDVIVEEVESRRSLPKRELINFLKGKVALSTIYANLNRAIKLGAICEVEAKPVWKYKLVDEISTDESNSSLPENIIYCLYGGEDGEYFKKILELFSKESSGRFELYLEPTDNDESNELIIRIRSKSYSESCKAKLTIMPKLKSTLSEFNLIWKPMEKVSINLNIDETAFLNIFKLAWDPREYETCKSIEDFILERETLTPPEERDEYYRSWRAFMEMRLKQHYVRMRLSMEPILTGILEKKEISIPFGSVLLLQIYSKETPPEKRAYILDRHHKVDTKSDKIAAYVVLYEIIDLKRRK